MGYYHCPSILVLSCGRENAWDSSKAKDILRVCSAKGGTQGKQTSKLFVVPSGVHLLTKVNIQIAK